MDGHRFATMRATLLLAGMAGIAPALARGQSTTGSDLRPAGTPVACIRQSAVRDTHVRDDRTIDFVMRNRQVYRNALPLTCPGLSRDRAFTHHVDFDQYCSGDTITVLFTGGIPIAGATCALGSFQPMERTSVAPGR